MIYINGREVLLDKVAGGTWGKIGTWTLPDFVINGTSLVTQLGLKAPLASPTFTGTVTLPATLPSGDNTVDFGSATLGWKDIYGEGI